MYKIAVSDKNGTLARLTAQACSRCGETVFLHGNTISCYGSGKSFLVADTDNISALGGDWIILCGSGSLHLPELGSGTHVIIADTTDHEALKALSGLKYPVIGCSMSGRDTISLSCFDGQTGLLSLLRPLPLPDGSLLEPCEVRIRSFIGADEYSLMAIGCVLLLCTCQSEGHELCLNKEQSSNKLA